MRWIRNHKAVSAAVAVVILGVGAWLVFGYFQFHKLFIDDVVHEAEPTFDSGADASDVATTTTASPEESTEAPPVPTTPSTTAPVPVVETLAEGEFVGRSHPAEGRVVVLSDGTQTFLRFEDFETDNGPDLFVYLSRGVAQDGPEDSFDDDYVDLGVLKGNVGEQNYEIPSDVDLAEFSTVVVWCREFSVAFGAADLT